MAKRSILVTHDQDYTAQDLEGALARLGWEATVQEVDLPPAHAEDFFATAIDMLCMLDFNGHFTRLSPSWERTLGFTLGELMSRPFIEFVHPDDRARTLEQNALVRAGGQARDFENRYLCKDGSFRWFRWNSTPVTVNRLIYAVARDVTEQKRADEERARLMGELQTALAEVKTLQKILPICSYCRKVRDDENYWHSVEVYVAMHTDSRFSHSICPSCMPVAAKDFMLPESERA